MRKLLHDTFHGKMLVNDLDPYIGKSLLALGEFSYGECELFMKVLKFGDVAVDVGANIGVFTLEMSQFVGPKGAVIAYEPQRHLFQTLCANVALNNRTNVFAYEAGVGATAGTAWLKCVDPDQPANYGGLSINDLRGGGEKTPIVALDDEIGFCNFIKIDVEGMEGEVIEGAKCLISECHPFLYVENDREEKSAALLDQLRSFGYTPRWHTPHFFRPDNYRGAPNPFDRDFISLNLVCQPPGMTLFDHLPLGKEPRP